MFALETPAWFHAAWLMPLLWAATWARRAPASRRARLASAVLRSCIALALIVALTQPVSTTRKTELIPPTVVMLQDVSDSVGPDEEAIGRHASDYAATLPENVQVERICFASAAWTEESPADSEKDETNIEAALDFACTRMAFAPNSHIVLFSDGRSTMGDPLAAAVRIRAAEGRVHVIPFGTRTAAPPRIDAAVPPVDARIGAPARALIRLRIDGHVDLSLAVLDQDGIEICRSQVRTDSDRVVAMSFVPQRKGIHRWRVVLRPSEESRPPLDTTDLWFHVAGPPSLLLCDPDPIDLEPLRRVLEVIKYDCIIAPVSAFPQDAESMAQYDAILISDWPSPQLTATQQQQLNDYVAAGGGLLFIGGTQVNGKRWHGSELERLLPVDLAPETATVIQKAAPVHVCFVLDASGSMAEPLGVDGSGSPVTKFQMMKQAVLASVQELPSSAVVSLIAFDIDFRIVLQAVPIAERSRIAQAVMAMTVGGGTNMTPAIREAGNILNTSSIAKQLILLTDGESLENPTEADAAWLRNSDIGVTAIAVGADSNTHVLREFADRTRGHYFFCGDAATIPRIFVSTARTIKTISVMPRKPFEPRLGPQPEIARGLADPWPILQAAIPAVPKKSALVEVPLLAEREQPLLALWSIGLGRVGAFMSDAKPIWADHWFRWRNYKRFWARLLASVIHQGEDCRTRIEVTIRGSQCIALASVRDAMGHLMPDVVAHGSLKSLSEGGATVENSIRWRQLPSGLFEGKAPLDPKANHSCDLDFRRPNGKLVFSHHCLLSTRRGVEFQGNGPDEERLRAIASAGGGLYSPSPSDLSEAIGKPAARSRSEVTPLWPWFVTIALVLWPVDVACRKFAR